MNLNDFNASKYLGKNDVSESGLTLTLAGFGIEEMKKDGEKKPYCTFVQVGVKPMLLNKSNRQRLSAIFKTDDTAAMIGRQVVVYNDPLVEFGGQVVGGLRIRPVPVVAPAAAASLTQAEKELQEALAMLKARAAAAPVPGQSAGAVDPNDEIPF